MKGWWYLRPLAYGEPQISSFGRRKVEETLATFGVSFSKPFLLHMGYSQPFKILTFCIFYISVFVNTTAMVVHSCAILYMCMEVIICQLDSSLWKIDDISDPWHRRTSNQLRWEKECGGNSCNFWVSFSKLFLLQMGYSQTSKILTFCIFHISVFVNITAMVVISCAILYMCLKVKICQLDSSLWKIDDITDP